MGDMEGPSIHVLFKNWVLGTWAWSLLLPLGAPSGQVPIINPPLGDHSASVGCTRWRLLLPWRLPGQAEAGELCWWCRCQAGPSLVDPLRPHSSFLPDLHLPTANPQQPHARASRIPSFPVHRRPQADTRFAANSDTTHSEHTHHAQRRS